MWKSSTKPQEEKRGQRVISFFSVPKRLRAVPTFRCSPWREPKNSVKKENEDTAPRGPEGGGIPLFAQ